MNRLFWVLWWATVISNIGTGMHEVATGWLMTELAPSPFMVSMVQCAQTLPFFFLALPAGVLADRIDRRLYLLVTQGWMLVAAAAMALMMVSDAMTPWRLLTCTCVLALGTALNSPAWHAVTPEIVDAEQLPRAVTYNTAAINVAKAVGPALGGLIVVFLGPAAAFGLNALSFLAVLGVVFRWKRTRSAAQVAEEPFLSSLRVGLQYVRHSPYFRNVIMRVSLFIFCCNSLLGLLPLICQRMFALDGRGYGLALGLFGVGAVFGALLVLPRLRQEYTTDEIVSGSWLAMVPVLAGLSWFSQLWVPMIAAGVAWSCFLSCCHLAAQSLAPQWVRARAMSVYLFSFFGAACTGSALWGFVASHWGLDVSLIASACLLIIGALQLRGATVVTGENFALRTEKRGPEVVLADHPPSSRCKVLVTVEYDIDVLDRVDFQDAMERLRRIRYRSGVLNWGVFVDLENPRIHREVFLEESWSAHLLHRQRMTDYDAMVLERAWEYHRGSGPPRETRQTLLDQHFPLDYGLTEEQKATGRRPPAWYLN